MRTWRNHVGICMWRLIPNIQSPWIRLSSWSKKRGRARGGWTCIGGNIIPGYNHGAWLCSSWHGRNCWSSKSGCIGEVPVCDAGVACARTTCCARAASLSAWWGTLDITESFCVSLASTISITTGASALWDSGDAQKLLAVDLQEQLTKPQALFWLLVPVVP